MKTECPMADKKFVNKTECETCEYKDDCIAWLLDDFEAFVMEKAGQLAKIIKEIIKKHEIKNT